MQGRGEQGGLFVRRNTLTTELLAEFLGTFTLLIFGLGVVAHFVLRNAVGDPLPAPGTFGNFTTVNFAWGFGVVMGVYVAGGVSGAHINPAVSVGLALRRGFPWGKVGPYILAQVLGAFVAAVLIRWNFYEWFNQVDPGKTFATQGVYSTSPGPGMSVLGGLRSEIIGTALLLMLILAITDARNTAPGANLAPFIIGLAVVVIGMSLGATSGYAINPARDFGPRLASWIMGWSTAMQEPGGSSYFWVPIIGPFIGGAIGVYVYDLFVGNFLPAEGDVGEVGEVVHPPEATT
ncbi:MAG TPA: MIP/aquaporin family protein [Actinomycetota bacterium]|nr:MIP/aquaporin family protein [Actinomycetota bacterium]